MLTPKYHILQARLYCNQKRDAKKRVSGYFNTLFPAGSEWFEETGFLGAGGTLSYLQNVINGYQGYAPTNTIWHSTYLQTVAPLEQKRSDAYHAARASRVFHGPKCRQAEDVQGCMIDAALKASSTLGFVTTAGVALFCIPGTSACAVVAGVGGTVGGITSLIGITDTTVKYVEGDATTQDLAVSLTGTVIGIVPGVPDGVGGKTAIYMLQVTSSAMQSAYDFELLGPRIVE